MAGETVEEPAVQPLGRQQHEQHGSEEKLSDEAREQAGHQGEDQQLGVVSNHSDRGGK